LGVFNGKHFCPIARFDIWLPKLNFRGETTARYDLLPPGSRLCLQDVFLLEELDWIA
jgi:hypothetical protein